MNDKTYTFITKASLGECTYCNKDNKNVYDNQLFVFIEKENTYYHFSCYNNKVKEENER